MKNRIATILVALAVLFGLGAVTAPAQADVAAATAPASVQSAQAGTPWTGYRFNSRYLCVQNNIGSTWDIVSATNAFESGYVTVVAENRGPSSQCNTTYLNEQIVALGTYSAADGQCWDVSFSSLNGRYTNVVVIGMNLHSTVANCRDTLQHRNNSVSTALGTAFGLAEFYSATSFPSSIMNTKFANTYNFAGTDDRNSLYALY